MDIDYNQLLALATEYGIPLLKALAILVVGKREAEERTVALRRLGGKAQEILALDQAISMLSAEAAMPER